MTSRHAALVAAAVAALAAPLPAFAQLNLLGGVDAHGTGLGHVATILTLQNSPTETGCIGPVGVTSCVLGDAKTGSSQTNLFSVSDFPSLTGSNLQLVLNFNEPTPAQGATLNNATLTLYNGTTALFNSSTGTVNFANTTPGIGTPDFAFGFSSTDAALFDTFLAQPGSGNYTLGLNASLSGVSGGPETFYLAEAVGTPSVVPEPGSLALLGTGLVGLLPIVRRKRRK